jgi:hypothetical protein
MSQFGKHHFLYILALQAPEVLTLRPVFNLFIGSYTFSPIALMGRYTYKSNHWCPEIIGLVQLN